MSLKKAQVLNEREQFEAALQMMEKVEMLGGKDSNYALFKSDIYIMLGKFNKAAACLLDAESLFDKEDKDILYIELSEVYESWGKLNSAIKYLRKALLEYPENEEALSRIMYIFDTNDLNEEGASFHKEVIDRQPYNYTAWNNLAYFYFKASQFDKALEAYDYAIVIDEDDARGYKGAGLVCFEKSNYNEAIRFFKVAHNIKETAETTSLLGSCNEFLGDNDKAEMYYKQSISLNESYDVPYFNLSLLYKRADKLYMALNHILKASEFDPFNLIYLEELADTYHVMGDTKKAIDTHIKIAKIDKRRKSNWIGLSQKYAEIDAYDLAIETIDKTMDELGQEVDLLYVKSAYLIIDGHKKEGMQILENALSQNYDLHDIIYDMVPGIEGDEDIIELIEQFK